MRIFRTAWLAPVQTDTKRTLYCCSRNVHYSPGGLADHASTADLRLGALSHAVASGTRNTGAGVYIARRASHVMETVCDICHKEDECRIQVPGCLRPVTHSTVFSRTPEYSWRMITIKLCGDCDRKLAAASQALRHHSAEMSKAIERVHAGSLTAEEHQDLRTRLWVSFNDAEAAFDTYRQHLIEHGLLTADLLGHTPASLARS